MSKLPDYVANVCKVGHGAQCCSYVAVSASGWECLKMSPLAANIAIRRAQGSMNAMGDNCDGREDLNDAATGTRA